MFKTVTFSCHKRQEITPVALFDNANGDPSYWRSPAHRDVVCR